MPMTELKNYPCLIDLHLHLDGSLSLDSVKKLAAKQNIQLENDETVLKKLSVSEGCRDLNEYLEKFTFPNIFLQTKEGIEGAVFNLCEELKEQGLIYAEIRFAPQKSTDNGLSQKEVVEAAIKGLNASDFKANLILCCMRGNDNHEANVETINVAKEFLNKGVVAVDLAGAEALFPTSEFEDLFVLARKNGIPFTIHAGEAAGADSICKALSFGACRIGHGVNASGNDALIDKLVKDKITLELCPTSNLNTAIFQDLSQYPIDEFIKKGVLFTINTDNTSVSATDINREFNLIAKEFSLTDRQIGQLLLNAANASFASDDTKNNLINLIKRAYDI